MDVANGGKVVGNDGKLNQGGYQAKPGSTGSFEAKKFDASKPGMNDKPGFGPKPGGSSVPIK